MCFAPERFPGLWLDSVAFWRQDESRLLTVLEEGLRSEEHAHFTEGLKAGGPVMFDAAMHLGIANYAAKTPIASGSRMSRGTCWNVLCSHTLRCISISSGGESRWSNATLPVLLSWRLKSPA